MCRNNVEVSGLGLRRQREQQNRSEVGVVGAVGRSVVVRLAWMLLVAIGGRALVWRTYVMREVVMMPVGPSTWRPVPVGVSQRSLVLDPGGRAAFPGAHRSARSRLSAGDINTRLGRAQECLGSGAGCVSPGVWRAEPPRQ